MIYCWFVISQYTALTSSYVCWLMLVIPSMCWWNFRLHPSRPPVLLWEPSVASPKIRGGTRATGRFSKGAGDGDPEIHMGFLPQQASFALFLVACWGDSLRIRNDKSIHVMVPRMILFTNMSWLIFKTWFCFNLVEDHLTNLWARHVWKYVFLCFAWYTCSRWTFTGQSRYKAQSRIDFS